MSRTAGCRNPPAPQLVLLWSSVPKRMLIGAIKAQCSTAIEGRPYGKRPSHACTSYPRVVSRTSAGRYFQNFMINSFINPGRRLRSGFRDRDVQKTFHFQQERPDPRSTSFALILEEKPAASQTMSG